MGLESFWWTFIAYPSEIKQASSEGVMRMSEWNIFKFCWQWLSTGIPVAIRWKLVKSIILCKKLTFRMLFSVYIPLPYSPLSYSAQLPTSIHITPVLIVSLPFLLLRQEGGLTIICSQTNRRMLSREHLFQLTDPHPSHRFSCTTSSLPHHSSPPRLPVPPDTLRKTQLKFKYLHRLDVQAIDRKYDLLEKLKRITRVEPTGETGAGEEGREKQYSIESYYLFNENEPMERRYQLQRHHPQRNKSHDNLHLQALSNEELIRHQLNDHREFLERFKPKHKESQLAKRFRLNKHTHGKLRPFE